MGTSNLTNHDFIIVKDRISHQYRGYHLVYVDVTIVIWHDLVLRTVDLQIISPIFHYIRGNLMLIIVNLAILTLY